MGPPDGSVPVHSAVIFPESLVFALVVNSQPGCLLTIKNTGSQPLAFKVKTTEPKRFLVRPNQSLIPAGGQESVNVYVVEKEASALFEKISSVPDAPELGADKFLVQTVPVSEEFYENVTGMLAKAQGDELARLWNEVPKKELRSKKLPVEYRLANPGPAAPGAGAGAVASAARSSSDLQPTPLGPGGAAAAATFVAGASADRRRARGSESGGSSNGGGNGGGMAEELWNLRKKYEELVAYTANLTEDRNVLNRELEDRKKALQREMAQRIALESKDMQRRSGTPGGAGAASGAQGPKALAAKGGKRSKGYSVMQILVVVVACFMAGKWHSSRGGGIMGFGGSIDKGSDGAKGGGEASIPPAAPVTVEDDARGQASEAGEGAAEL